MVKAMHVAPLSGLFQFCYVFLGMQGITTETTVASIFEELLQGQGPYLCIQAHGQRACGLPKVTHSVNNRAQRRIPTAAISALHPCPHAGLQMDTFVSQGTLSL